MDGAIFSARVDDIEYIKFLGIVRYSHCGGLEAHIDQIFNNQSFSDIVIDLEEAEILDSTALGLLARIAIEFKKMSNGRPVVFVKRGELFNILKRVCFDQVFNILAESSQNQKGQYEELVAGPESEQAVLKRVIDAHEYLAKIDQKNEQLFKDITKAVKF